MSEINKKQEEHVHHTHDHPHDHNHSHTHDPKHIQNIVNRISRSIGHLNSVKSMVERGEDCSDVLIQLAAVKGELNSISKKILEEHLDHCIKEAIDEHDMEAIEKLHHAINHMLK